MRCSFRPVRRSEKRKNEKRCANVLFHPCVGVSLLNRMQTMSNSETHLNMQNSIFFKFRLGKKYFIYGWLSNQITKLRLFAKWRDAIMPCYQHLQSISFQAIAAAEYLWTSVRWSVDLQINPCAITCKNLGIIQSFAQEGTPLIDCIVRFGTQRCICWRW
jgi:hypothetical protein